MSTNPWMKFYPTDWRNDPRLKMVSRAARSLWMDMICLMHEADRYGDLSINGKPLDASNLAAVVGDNVNDVTEWLQELSDAGVYSVRKNGTIYSRRMERDENKRRKLRENGKKGGNPKLCKQSENETLVIQEDKTTEARSQIPDTRDKKQKALPSSKKGTRLSEDWTLSEKNLADAQTQGIVGDRVNVEADKFRDYWIAKPGQGGLKLDWDATWRNWCRNASSRSAAAPARRDRWAGVDDPNAGKSFDEIFGTGNVVAIGGRQ